MSLAYYNENDPHKAIWLRNLIDAGHIAPGDVDERDIRDVRPVDLMGYTQCHFFAGIGLWSAALRRGGWPDTRPVWTASCPCQPFSAAGKGDGFDDERHLWPDLFWLVQQRRPVTLIGEQVASKDGLAWLDLVQTDLEASAYTGGAGNYPAAGFGAPHWRQRLYWFAQRMAHGAESGWSWERGAGSAQDQRTSECGAIGELADNKETERQFSGAAWAGRAGLANDGGVGLLGDTDQDGRNQRRECQLQAGSIGTGRNNGVVERKPQPGPTNGEWADVDWIFCRDGKWRPAESRIFPLVDGYPDRVAHLRAYGDAIVPPQAAAFVEAAAEVIEGIAA